MQTFQSTSFTSLPFTLERSTHNKSGRLPECRVLAGVRVVGVISAGSPGCDA